MRNKDSQLLKSKLDIIIITVLFLVSFIAWLLHSVNMHVKPVKYRVKTFTDDPQTFTFVEPPAEGFKVQGLLGVTCIEWNDKGQVRISESACQNKTCVRMGWVNNSGIMCVPNGVLVEAITKQESEFDAVTR